MTEGIERRLSLTADAFTADVKQTAQDGCLLSASTSPLVALF